MVEHDDVVVPRLIVGVDEQPSVERRRAQQIEKAFADDCADQRPRFAGPGVVEAPRFDRRQPLEGRHPLPPREEVASRDILPRAFCAEIALPQAEENGSHGH